MNENERLPLPRLEIAGADAVHIDKLAFAHQLRVRAEILRGARKPGHEQRERGCSDDELFQDIAACAHGSSPQIAVWDRSANAPSGEGRAMCRLSSAQPAVEDIGKVQRDPSGSGTVLTGTAHGNPVQNELDGSGIRSRESQPADIRNAIGFTGRKNAIDEIAVAGTQHGDSSPAVDAQCD